MRIVQGQGDDDIVGTNSSDEILADSIPLDDQGGDDTVRALSGDDTVRGFGGNNYINGGPGNDTLTTADGRDQIYGGGGADDVQSGRGADVVHGGAGNDALHGGEGDDLLYGEAGADRVIGSSDNDTLYGGVGSDTLEGRDGQDTFAWSAANEGKDTIVDFSLGEDHFRLGSFLTGFDGSEAKLERFVRFVPDSSGAASVLQVDADGPASGGWRDLALAQGAPDLHALPLYQVGDLLIDGRSPEGPFDSLAYIASYDDLVHAFGANTAAGKQHYIAHGYDEGRSVTFDGLQYIATYGDLIHALGPAPKAGTEHFIQHGLGEERERDGFDEVQYVANYPDLQAVFGTDYEAATRHYIVYGHDEERTDKPLGAAQDFMV